MHAYGVLFIIPNTPSSNLANIATLYVGEGRIRYYAHEDTLCQLPFFQAALRGHFKEATEKTISMPEDDPEAVSALIESLYTGSVKYDKNMGLHEITMELRDASWAPPTFFEGLFYIEVLNVAFKYGCTKLCSEMLDEFYRIQETLSDIGIFRLYKSAASIGVCPPIRIRQPPLIWAQSTLFWYGRIRAKHLQEVEATLEAFSIMHIRIMNTIAPGASLLAKNRPEEEAIPPGTYC